MKEDSSNNKQSEIIIFKTKDDNISVDVIMNDETVWLTQEQMAELFNKAKSTINEHIKNIYNEKELIESETMHKFGNSEFQQKAPNYYNLDVIISVGYRVKSLRGTEFRKWATQRLKEYKKYQIKTLSQVEKDYLENIKTLEKDIFKNKKNTK